MGYCQFCGENPQHEEKISLRDGRTVYKSCVSSLNGRVQREKRGGNHWISLWQGKLRTYRCKKFIVILFVSPFQIMISPSSRLSKKIEENIQKLHKRRRQFVDRKKQEIDKKQKVLREFYEVWPSTPPDWTWRFQKLKKKHGGRCQICNSSTEPLTIDFKNDSKAIKKRYGFNNLILTCEPCLQDKPARKRREKGERNLEIIKKSMSSNSCLKFHYHFEKKWLTRRQEEENTTHIFKAEKIYDFSDKYVSGLSLTLERTCKFRPEYMEEVEIVTEYSLKKNTSMKIEYAFQKDLMVHCHYTKSTGGRSYRTLKPIKYSWYKGFRVLTCFDHLSGEKRNFATRRMKEVELVSKPKEQKIISGTY